MRVWDAETGALLHTFETPDEQNWTGYAPDGKTFAGAGWNGAIRIWGGALLKTFEGHTGGMNSAGYAPDGKTFWSAGNDGTVLFWDISDI